MNTAYKRVFQEVGLVPIVLGCRFCDPCNGETWDLHHLIISNTFQIICDECGNESGVFGDPMETVNDWNKGQI